VLERQRPVALVEGLHQGASVLAVEQLHGEEVLAVRLADVVDLDDVRVAQRRRDARLVEEHPGDLGLDGEVGQDPLDDDELLEPLDAGGAREEDLGHPPGGDVAQDLVLAQPERPDAGHARRRRWLSGPHAARLYHAAAPYRGGPNGRTAWR
jgi:hypothetical protein